LILAAQNEAEFAGMFAHSIAHVAARHGTRLVTRGELANLASIPLIYMGGWNGNGDALIPIGFLSTQRAYELEADRLAVRMMAGAGYDPGALVRYIVRVQPANTDMDMQKVFSALPSVSDRTAGMEQAIRQLPAGTYSSGDGIQPIQEEVRRLNPPPAPPKPPSLLK
jgi:predicted Zn-dependent protease